MGACTSARYGSLSTLELVNQIEAMKKKKGSSDMKQMKQKPSASDRIPPEVTTPAAVVVPRSLSLSP